MIEYDKIILSIPQNNMTAARGLVEIVTLLIGFLSGWKYDLILFFVIML